MSIDKTELISIQEEINTLEKKYAVLHANLLSEAITNRETYTALIWHYQSSKVYHFLFLEEALRACNGDCSPEWLKAPDGTELDCYTGEIVEGENK